MQKMTGRITAEQANSADKFMSYLASVSLPATGPNDAPTLEALNLVDSGFQDKLGESEMFRINKKYSCDEIEQRLQLYFVIQ